MTGYRGWAREASGLVCRAVVVVVLLDALWRSLLVLAAVAAVAAAGAAAVVAVIVAGVRGVLRRRRGW